MCAQVSTVQPGIVKVMVHDLCLAFQTPATATVHISNILEVNVRVVDKVSWCFFLLNPTYCIRLESVLEGLNY